ncbi:MAG: hypothetical protein HYY13_03955 [Nitrospirae bacterium]|nr:hypothetical protein [Nitrospirota bacterium]
MNRWISLPLAAAALTFASCFEAFETIHVDTGWRMKYAVYVQSELPEVVNRFNKMLQDYSVTASVGRAQKLATVSYDGEWIEAAQFSPVGFQTTIQEGGKNGPHKVTLTRTWTAEKVSGYVGQAGWAELAAQARRPGKYTLTLQLPGAIRSAVLVKNAGITGEKRIHPDKTRGGKAIWLVPDLLLVDMTSMTIEASFTGRMTAKEAPPATTMAALTGCQSPVVLSRAAKALAGAGAAMGEARLTPDQRQARYREFLPEVSSLEKECANSELGASLGKLRAVLSAAPATAAPAPTPTPPPPPKAAAPPPPPPTKPAPAMEEEEGAEEEESEEEEEEEE